MKKFLLTLGIFSSMALVCLPACVTRHYQDYETYYETAYRTEYRTESYVTTEEVVTTVNRGEEVLAPNMKWFNSALMSDINRPLYYYGYIVPAAEHSKREVRIAVAHNQSGRVKVYAGGGSIPANSYYSIYLPFYFVDPAWLYSLNTWLSTATLLGTVSLGSETTDAIVFDASKVAEFAVFVDSWDSTAINGVTLLWTDQAVTRQNVTKQRQVAVSVPYQVEKKRLVTREKTVPFWEPPWAGQEGDNK